MLRRSKLLLLLAILPFGVAPGFVHAGPGLRFGVQGLYFHPDSVMSNGTQLFNRFWGLGVELGWVPLRHWEVEMELNFAYASPRGGFNPTEGFAVRKDMMVAALMLKGAYRFKLRSTPYIGLGYGKGATGIGYYYNGSPEVDHIKNSAAYTIWKPFVGYDFRRYKHLGFRAEAQYQLRNRVYLKGLSLVGETYLVW